MLDGRLLLKTVAFAKRHPRVFVLLYRLSEKLGPLHRRLQEAVRRERAMSNRPEGGTIAEQAESILSHVLTRRALREHALMKADSKQNGSPH